MCYDARIHFTRLRFTGRPTKLGVSGSRSEQRLANRCLFPDRSTFSRMPLAAAPPGQFVRATQRRNAL